jgi:hypothetical protein
MILNSNFAYDIVIYPRWWRVASYIYIKVMYILYPFNSQTACLEKLFVYGNERQNPPSFRSPHPLKSRPHLSTTGTDSISLKTTSAPLCPYRRRSHLPCSPSPPLQAGVEAATSLPGQKSPSRTSHSTSSCCCRWRMAMLHDFFFYFSLF